MDLKRKLSILADAAKYDVSCSSSGAKRKTPRGGLGDSDGTGICHSYTPDGRCVSLLKILFTNACMFDCLYCINRVSSDVERTSFTVQEVVDLTLSFYRRNLIEGLFLSSGIVKNPDFIMEKLVRVARKLREEENFGGYIHLKSIPGSAPELLCEAGKYADRLSMNIELPSPQSLRRLAPAKTHAEIERGLAIVKRASDESAQGEGRGKSTIAPAGQSTQMIVGASDESDREVLKKSASLYQGLRLRRIYYSSFSPIQDSSPLLPAFGTPHVRENRLYQSDWLMRFYRFKVEEIVPEDAPNLSMEFDPKTAWALRNRQFFPVDVNSAEFFALLRVPGIGVRSAKRVVQARKYQKIRNSDLLRLGVSLKRAQYFLVTSDSLPVRGLELDDFRRLLLQPQGLKRTQLSFDFDRSPVPEPSVVTGEL